MGESYERRNRLDDKLQAPLSLRRTHTNNTYMYKHIYIERDIYRVCEREMCYYVLEERARERESERARERERDDDDDGVLLSQRGSQASLPIALTSLT